LTRRPTEYAVNPPAANSRSDPDVGGLKTDDGARQYGGLREIELMRSTVNGINLNCSRDVEPRLFESQAHTAYAGEKVDCERSGHLRFLGTNKEQK
jgi:hypothetical protein